MESHRGLFESLPKDVLRIILSLLERASLLRLRQAWRSAVVDDFVFAQLQPPYALSDAELARAQRVLQGGGFLRKRFVVPEDGAMPTALSWMALGARVRFAKSVSWTQPPDLAPVRTHVLQNLFETLHLLDDKTVLACGHAVVRTAWRTKQLQRVPLTAPKTYVSASLLLDGNTRLLVGTSDSSFEVFSLAPSAVLATPGSTFRAPHARGCINALAPHGTSAGSAVAVTSAGVTLCDLVTQQCESLGRAGFERTRIAYEKLYDVVSIDDRNCVFAVSGSKGLSVLDVRVRDAVVAVLNDGVGKTHHTYAIWSLAYDRSTGCLFSGGGDSLVCAWDMRRSADTCHLQSFTMNPPTAASAETQKTQFVMQVQLDGSTLYAATAEGRFAAARWNGSAKTIGAPVLFETSCEQVLTFAARGDTVLLSADGGVHEMQIK